MDSMAPIDHEHPNAQQGASLHFHRLFEYLWQ